MLSGHVSDWRKVTIPDRMDIISEVDKLIQIHNEPIATATWLSHRRICKFY
jgi:hypothetical protein